VKIPFNKPYLTGKEFDYIRDAVSSQRLCGNGKYTQLCQEHLQQRYGFAKCLLTSSCTDALEMAAILLNIQPGDEVIMPSYTFVSTANAFVLRGARIVFVDSRPDHPGMDESAIEALITPKTKAIVPVHYAGVACDMDVIMDVANRHGLFVVEDAAQAIDSYYTGKDGKKRPLGSIGHLAAFSFHETKNIISGEGGMLVVNDMQFAHRAEIIWEKGTNRSAFYRGEVDKYGWVDVGSSFLPSEMVAAFLWAQLEHLDSIQERRKAIWETYYRELGTWAESKGIKMPFVPGFATNNAHMFYLVFPGLAERTETIERLKTADIHPVFHYQSLHASPYYAHLHHGGSMHHTDRYSDALLRLPFYNDIDGKTQSRVIQHLTA
jgi:dTDP-4-amino-4,6-dideoxygalactose transaminase